MGVERIKEKRVKNMLHFVNQRSAQDPNSRLSNCLFINISILDFVGITFATR